MSEKQMRRMISYKIENLSPKERALVDEWANGQFNIQQSLTNIIMHVVGFIGNADVMDFDVQKQLHLTLGNAKQHQEDDDIIKPLSPVAAPKQKQQREEKDEYPDPMDMFDE